VVGRVKAVGANTGGVPASCGGGTGAEDTLTGGVTIGGDCAAGAATETIGVDCTAVALGLRGPVGTPRGLVELVKAEVAAGSTRVGATGGGLNAGAVAVCDAMLSPV